MSERPLLKVQKASAVLKKRITTAGAADAELEAYVKPIIADVRKRGDAALVEYTKKFDRVDLAPENLRVTKQEIKEAYNSVSAKQISALKLMKKKVEAFENRLLKQANFVVEDGGVKVRSSTRPLQSVGCYVPGGRAAYPSTLIMTVVPAKVAGVPRIVVCSPPTADGKVNPLVLVAADLCKADEVYRVGGAQAVAALAYGTETIKPVRKIVGPGNKYVTMAKLLVSREVAIDMPAGPSEVLILADETADPQLVALDMISQAEHSTDSIAGLVTTSEELAENVITEVEKRASSIRRSETVVDALMKNGFIIICESVDDAVEFANVFAPEHLEVLVEKPVEVVEKVTSAGLVLLGRYSPVAASDYCVGTNHVLPTGGFSRVFSGLSVLDFVRHVNLVECSKEGLLKIKDSIEVLAEAEDLPNHFRAVEGRFES